MTRQQQEIQTSKHFVEDIEHLEGMIEQAILYIHNTNQYIKDLDQLNVDIKSAIREMELKIVELEIYFEEEPLFLKESKEEEFKMKMLNKLSEIRKRISNLKVKQRKANQVYSTKKLNLLRKRNLLLANNELEDENKKNNKLIRKGNQLVTKQSKLVTQSLLRTKSIIETNIERTSTSMDKLNESSSIFQNTLSIHDEYQDKVLQSKKLINDLKWKERRDNLVTLICFLFFIFVVLYVFNHRIPIFSILFYFIKLFFSFFYMIFTFIFGSNTMMNDHVMNNNNITNMNHNMSVNFNNSDDTTKKYL